MNHQFPIINLEGLFGQDNEENKQKVEKICVEIDKACREFGFFIVENFGVTEEDFQKVQDVAKKFFELPEEAKAKMRVQKGGKNLRGWFGLGKSLIDQRGDGSEGIYCGSEDPDTDPRPLHGPNLFPDDQLPEMRQIVLKHIEKMTKCGHIFAKCIQKALNLSEQAFNDVVRDPTIRACIFQYPPNDKYQFGIGQHTDYGFLSFVCIDDCGGLQIKSLQGEWIDVPKPAPGKHHLVINLGDMVYKLSKGKYRSTPHRVKTPANKKRISLPFFFNPSWDAKFNQISQDQTKVEVFNWDKMNLGKWSGEYGDYEIQKVNNLFPQLQFTKRYGREVAK